MKKNIFSIAFLAVTGFGLSQVNHNTGINTTNPQATLDIEAITDGSAKAEGIMIPRLTGDEVLAMTANLGTEQQSMMVFVTAPATDTSNNNLTYPAYYRFNIQDDGAGNVSKSWIPIEPSGLEKVGDLGSSNYRIIGEDPTAHADASQSSFNIDMSIAVPGENRIEPIGTFGDGAIAIGAESRSIDSGVAIGVYAKTSQPSAIALGSEAKANGINSTAIGRGYNFNTIANGNYSTAIGGATTGGNADFAVAIGSLDGSSDSDRTTANAWGSLAMMGGIVHETAPNSIAIGTIGNYGSQTNAANSLAMMGGVTGVGAKNSIAIGGDTKANGPSSLALSHGKTTEKASEGVAIGPEAVSNAYKAVAIGYSRANGKASTAIGSDAGSQPSIANGHGSLALLGGVTSNDAHGSLALGFNSIAASPSSMAIGDGVKTSNRQEFSLGTYNFSTDLNINTDNYLRDSNYQLFSIGNGYYNSPSNALIILRNAKTGIGLPTDTTTPANSKPTEMLDVNGNVRVRGTGEAITVGGTCANEGTISYNNNVFYGCTANGWVKLNM